MLAASESKPVVKPSKDAKKGKGEAASSSSSAKETGAAGAAPPTTPDAASSAIATATTEKKSTSILPPISVHASDNWMDFPHRAKVLWNENLPTCKKVRNFCNNPRYCRLADVPNMKLVVTKGNTQVPLYIGVVIPTSVDSVESVNAAANALEAELSAKAVQDAAEGGAEDKDDDEKGGGGWGMDCIAWPGMVGRYPCMHGAGKNTYQLQEIAKGEAGAESKIYDEAANIYDISGTSETPNAMAGFTPEELLDYATELVVAKKIGQAIIKKIGELIRTNKKIRTAWAAPYLSKDCSKKIKEKFPTATAFVDDALDEVIEELTDKRCFFQSGKDGNPCPYEVFKFTHRIVSKTIPKKGSGKAFAEGRIAEAKALPWGTCMDFAKRQAEAGHFVRKFNVRWIKKGFPLVYNKLTDFATQHVFDGALIIPTTRITVTIPAVQKKTMRAEIVRMDVQELKSDIVREEWHNDELFCEEDTRGKEELPQQEKETTTRKNDGKKRRRDADDDGEDEKGDKKKKQRKEEDQSSSEEEDESHSESETEEGDGTGDAAMETIAKKPSVEPAAAPVAPTLAPVTVPIADPVPASPSKTEKPPKGQKRKAAAGSDDQQAEPPAENPSKTKKSKHSKE